MRAPSARFDTNRHPRNGPEPRLYSRTRACAGAGADQSAGTGARKSNRPGVIRGVLLSAVNTAEPVYREVHRAQRKPVQGLLAIARP